MDTLRQQIVDSFIDALKTITIANGYGTDIGAKVGQWDGMPLQDKKVPAIIVDDCQDAVTESYNEHNHQLQVNIIAVDGGGRDIKNQMRQYLADIVKCVGVMAKSDGLTYDVSINTTDIEFHPAAKIIAAATVSCTASYNSALYDEYNKGLR